MNFLAVFIGGGLGSLARYLMGILVAKTNQNAKVIFYPFSGPDYLTAHAFFPNADKYVMLGLEPVGKLPELKKFKAGNGGNSP